MVKGSVVFWDSSGFGGVKATSNCRLKCSWVRVCPKVLGSTGPRTENKLFEIK